MEKAGLFNAWYFPHRFQMQHLVLIFIMSLCYGLNVCFPIPPPPAPYPGSYVEILTPDVMVFRGGTFDRCLGGEGGALVNGIRVCTGRDGRARSCPCSAASGCKPGSGSSRDIGSAGTMALDTPASRTVRSECLLFEPPSLWSFVSELGHLVNVLWLLTPPFCR